MGTPLPPPDRDSAAEAAFLMQLGDRVRAWRHQHAMTRKALALGSGVSERYLAQLEAGQGNMSVLLLRKVARAMGVPLEQLVREESATARDGRIALIGLRGAGKSSLGARLAEVLGVPVVELDQEVEKEAGAPLGEVFAMYGQEAYRRFERRALERVLRQHKRAVIAAGGSLVTDPDTYQRLLDQCWCVWLKASPEEHMARVISQGDMRPFKGRSAALDEVRRLLSERERLYSRADAILDTSTKTLRQCAGELRALTSQPSSQPRP